MPIINTWVPSAFVVLLTVLTMFTLLVFERKTKVRVLHVAAVVIGVFSCYQLYCNIEAGVDFLSSMVFLGVGIVAIAVCEKVATLERTKMIEEQKGNQQATDIEDQPAVEELTEAHEEGHGSETASVVNPDTTQKQAEEGTIEEAAEDEPTEATDKKTASEDDTQQVEEIASLRAQSQANKAQELEKDKALVLAWFNKQIVNFSDAEQLNLRKYAEAFLTSGEVAVRTIPENDGSYTQQSITKICSAFRVAGMSREACAHFAKTVFSAFYPDTLENTIAKKFVGIPKMREIIEESL